MERDLKSGSRNMTERLNFPFTLSDSPHLYPIFVIDIEVGVGDNNNSDPNKMIRYVGEK